jgi:hypothetical protein
LGDIYDRCGARKAGHDDRGVARELTDVTGNCNVGERKLGAPGGVRIETDDAPSAIDEVTSDRTPHDAKPDDANGLVHESCLLSNSIDG